MHFTTTKSLLIAKQKRKITYSETYLLEYSNFRTSVVVSDQYIYCFHVSLLFLVSFVFPSSESQILSVLSLHQYFYNLQFSFFHFHSQQYLHRQSSLNTFSIFCRTKPPYVSSIRKDAPRKSKILGEALNHSASSFSSFRRKLRIFETKKYIAKRKVEFQSE